MREQRLLQWLTEVCKLNPSDFHMISGDASFRRYFRFYQGNTALIGVDAPVETENSRQFCLLASAYEASGVNVPRVLHQDFEQGFMVLQDFGDCLLWQMLTPAKAPRLYAEALGQLPAIQRVTRTSAGALHHFDHDLLDAEFYLFTHWLLERHLALKLDQDQVNMLHDLDQVFKQTFAEQPQVGVHRDYHSRNLMLLGDESIGVIDFQDAVTGPLLYDAVSLLRDCYVRWPASAVRDWLSAWHRRYYSHIPFPQFSRWFDITGMQRHVKAAGIFARLHHRDGKSGYLADIPRTLGYLVEVGARYPELARFSAFVEERVLPAVHARQLAS